MRDEWLTRLNALLKLTHSMLVKARDSITSPIPREQPQLVKFVVECQRMLPIESIGPGSTLT